MSKSCPICQLHCSEVKKVNFKVPSSSVGLNSNIFFQLSKCQKCLLYFNSAFEERNVDYANANVETFFNHSDIQTEMSKVCNRIFKFLNKDPLTFTEFGCGDGEFLNLFKTEYKKFFKKNLNNLCGFDVGNSLPKKKSFTGNKKNYLESIDHDLTKFIAVRHVLEHLESTSSFFNDLKNINDIFLYIEVPNGYESIIKGKFEDLHYEHVSYMSFNSLLRMCNINNFTVLDMFESLNNENISILAYRGDKELKASEQNVEQEFLFFKKGFKKLRTHLDSNKKVFWGVGGRCKVILDRISKLDKKNKINCLLVDSDKNKDGLLLEGFTNKVVTPDKIPWKDIDEIIVGTRVGFQSIIKELSALKINIKLNLWDNI